MGEFQNYDSAVETIKTAILQSQYDAVRSVNEKQLMLYYGIGKYISMQTLPAAEQAFRAINTFKDEYLLDYINVEELGIRDRQDIL